MNSIYLFISVILLIPVALQYGLSPAENLPKVYAVTIEGVDLVHIFRAIMGLYLGFALFWLIGAIDGRWTEAAILSEVVFMGALALGRLFSLFMDGRPNPIWMLPLNQ